VPYSQRYLLNAIPDTNHNANPTNPNRYSKGNAYPTNPTNLVAMCNCLITEDIALPYKLLLPTPILDTVVNKAPTSQGYPYFLFNLNL